MDHSTALLTDRYELTMLQAALASDTAGRRAVFEVFARQLPAGRRYGVVGGIGRLLDALEAFRFDPPALEFLTSGGIVDEATATWLESYRFSGDIWGYAEGDLYFPGSPILVVEGSFAEAVLLETLTLSILNHDSAIASAASRMVHAAAGRPIIEMGSRRTHEMAGVAAARAAYLAGFTSTSNLEAGRTYGVPTAGTSAHAFTLLHDGERHAFRAQLDALGMDTTLLVDTYDVARAVTMAVELAGSELGAVRLDSGDLMETAYEVRAQLDALGAPKTKIILTGDLDEYSIAALAAYLAGFTSTSNLEAGRTYGVPTAGTSAHAFTLLHDGERHAFRAQLDALGAPKTKIILTGDLDEYSIAALAAAPVNGYGVGTSLVTGSGSPTASLVFKLVARAESDSGPLRPVAKRSVGKPSRGGRKWALRHRGEDGRAIAEVVLRSEPAIGPHDRSLLVPLVRGGVAIGREPLAESRARHERALAELPPRAFQLSRGDPAIPTDFHNG